MVAMTSTLLPVSLGTEIITLGRNRLLGALLPDAVDALAPYLTETALPQGSVLYEPGETVMRVYFPCNGLVGLVGALPEGEEIDAAAVGREGAVGLIATMGSGIACHRAVVRVAGRAIHAPAGPVAELLDRSKAARAAIARYCDILTAQSQQAVACNTMHPIQERLSRWLLEARDRTGSDTLALTQEHLAGVLGVQRTTITLVARVLQTEGVVHVRRGRIHIRDAGALESKACGCYRIVRRLIEQIDREPATQLAAPPLRAGAAAELGAFSERPQL
jgi:CRP-like cAMP-binding protein